MLNKYLFAVMALVISVNVTAATMAGWSDENIDNLATVFSDALLSGAKTGYYQRAKEVGNSNPKPFPESEVKGSFDLMSQCITRLASEKWSYDEFMNNQGPYSKILLDEALAGGTCKPTGLVGRAVDRKSERNN